MPHMPLIPYAVAHFGDSIPPFATPSSIRDMSAFIHPALHPTSITLQPPIPHAVIFLARARVYGHIGVYLSTILFFLFFLNTLYRGHSNIATITDFFLLYVPSVAVALLCGLLSLFIHGLCVAICQSNGKGNSVRQLWRFATVMVSTVVKGT